MNAAEPRPTKWVAIALGQVALALGLAEVGIRVVNPEPRIQILRHDHGVEIETRHGVPVWLDGDGRRFNRACTDAPHDRTVLLIGDSITFGAGLTYEESVGVHLQALVDARFPDETWCVVNAGQPGLVFAPQLALATDLIADLDPDLVFWQLFYGSPNRPSLIGDAVYVLQGPAEYSEPPRLAPGPLHPVLFNYSHLYQYASLALIPGRSAPDWEALLDNEVPRAIELVAPAPLIFVLAPKLDRPFADHAHDPWPNYAEFKAFAAQEGLDVLPLADSLADRDVEALRRNTCCHYNPAGHQAYAEVLLGEIEERRVPVSAGVDGDGLEGRAEKSP